MAYRIIAETPKIRLPNELPYKYTLRETYHDDGSVQSYSVGRVTFRDGTTSGSEGAFFLVHGANTQQIQFQYAFANWATKVGDMNYVIRMNHSLVEVF